MWKMMSYAFANFGPRRESAKPNQVDQEFSDDETHSNASGGEGLECPICWESFNVVENVPYVLWCGHTLCKNCVLGLRWAVLKFSAPQIQIPFFVSCPWCNFLTFRLVYKGNLKFPSKNFFLLWLVECRNGDRVKSSPAICGDNQVGWLPRCHSVIANRSRSPDHHRTHHLGRLGSNNNDHNHDTNSIPLERSHLALHESIDFFISLIAKFPLVLVLFLCHMCTSNKCYHPTAILGHYYSLCTPIFSSLVLCISSSGLACKGDHHLNVATFFG